MKKIIVTSVTLIFLLTACSGKPEPTATPLPRATDTAIPLPSPTQEPTPTPLPTTTATAVPTFDYSQIKYGSMYFMGTTQTVLTFSMNGITGEYHGMGNEHRYECNFMPEDPATLFCYGPYQAPGKEMFFNLFENTLEDPVLSLEIIVPDPVPPTAVGMQCEVEPLWLSHGGSYGCYAVTCYIGSEFVTGSQDTCADPLPWFVP